MIKEYLEGFKTDNRLVNSVIDYYIDNYGNDENTDELFTNMQDLQQYGCQSGMIGSLIYYVDTIKFCEEYKEEINDLLSEMVSSTGCSIPELFGDKYDKEDPLNLGEQNRNLFAWFGFEETANRLYEQMQEKEFVLENEEQEEELEDPELDK